MKYNKFPLPARYDVPPENESITNLTQVHLKMLQTAYFNSPLHHLKAKSIYPHFKTKQRKEKKMDLFIWVSGQRDKEKLPLPRSSNTGLQMRFMTWDFLLSMDITEIAWEVMVICSFFWSWYLTRETC